MVMGLQLQWKVIGHRYSFFFRHIVYEMARAYDDQRQDTTWTNIDFSRPLDIQLHIWLKLFALLKNFHSRKRMKVCWQQNVDR